MKCYQKRNLIVIFRNLLENLFEQILKYIIYDAGETYDLGLCMSKRVILDLETQVALVIGNHAGLLAAATQNFKLGQYTGL